MAMHLKIDFVSDISCPWCVIGLKSLEAALSSVQSDIEVDLHFQPFELNPQMGAKGQDIVEHIAQKYGSSATDIELTRESIRARGAALGFEFNMQKRGRIYNTFDAHRLLFWAETQAKQQALKHALFTAYFTEGRDLSDHEVLIEVARKVALDEQRAKAILESDDFSAEVREREKFYTDRGIQAVPSVIINDQHLIQGGQPAEVFERVLRQLAR